VNISVLASQEGRAPWNE